MNLEDNTLYNEHSFFSSYSRISRVLVIFIFFDYLIRQTILVKFIDILAFPIALSVSLIYFSLFIIFFGIVLYRFYKELFANNLIYALIGILTLFLGLSSLFLRTILPQEMSAIVLSIFFILLLALYIIIFTDTLKLYNINEMTRGLIVFISVFTVLSSINAVLSSLNAVKIFSPFLSVYTVFYIQQYLANVASYSFLIVILYYIYLSLKYILQFKVYKIAVYFLICIMVFLVASIIFKQPIQVTVASFLLASGINVTLPLFIYVYILFIFLTTSLAIVTKTKTGFTLVSILLIIIISGLNIFDFYLRILSIFAITDLALFLKNNYLEE